MQTAPYILPYSAISSTTIDAQAMSDSFTMAGELANTATGTTPGASVPTGQVVPSTKLNTLADILSSCINSSGGTAGDLSSCGNLFSDTDTGGAPTDTVGSLLNIAQHPAINVSPIWYLVPSEAPFEPTLVSIPDDWTLAVTSSTPTPTFSPTPGFYTTLPSVTLSDSDPIYYTTDGSQPSSASALYASPIALSGTTTIRAIAIASSISSLLASATYALPPTISLTPTPVTLNTSQTQTFTATVTGSTNTSVTWSLSPAVGTISTTGLYTAPSSFGSTSSVTVTATSVADPAVSASAIVWLGHQVDLSWYAPSSSTDPVAGYNVYRSSDSGTTYQLLNSSIETTTYEDTAVTPTQTYEYYVESVDASGYTSDPSNTITVMVP